jgi:O-acetyl-ADP-ribose deacetylase
MGAKHKIRLKEGDITQMDVDGIVNAANTDLMLGAGVAGAIRRAGGPTIQEECNAIGPIPLGQAAVTGAGHMTARYVIHAASMSWGEATSEKSLVDSTENSLRRAEEKRMKSIAFPAIGTGVAGFPLDECARLMLQTVLDHLTAERTSLNEVWFVLFGRDAYDAFRREYDRLEEK